MYNICICNVLFHYGLLQGIFIIVPCALQKDLFFKNLFSV